jgi:hypothetical protein
MSMHCAGKCYISLLEESGDTWRYRLPWKLQLAYSRWTAIKENDLSINEPFLPQIQLTTTGNDCNSSFLQLSNKKQTFDVMYLL